MTEKRSSDYPKLSSSVSDEGILAKRGIILGKKLDCGAFATVRIAERITGDKRNEMAVKIIHRSKAPQIFIDKFLPRELKIVPLLQHRHIIRVFSIFHLRDKTFICMELAPNGDVTNYVQQEGALPERLAHKWFVQLLDALTYCHAKDIAHRDLKCENILLDSHMNVKLADFGFARFVKDSRGVKTVLSETFCGSAAYVAPEVIAGKPYNPKMSDVWSLGVCLYIMVNNCMPFDDRNVKKMLKDQTDRKWKFSSHTLSNSLKQLITNLLEPNILARPSLRRVSTDSWVVQPSYYGEGI